MTSMNQVAESVGVTPLIIYRHFDSKDALYTAVLERARDNMSDSLSQPSDSRLGIGVEAVLAAARDDADGFRLIWRHAAREPDFAPYAEELREMAITTVANELGQVLPDEAVQWAANATVGYLVESVLTWLDLGDPELDERFIKSTKAALRAGVRAWSTT